MKCAVCKYPYRHGDGYGIVNLGKGETAYEQLRSWQHYEVCGECADVLRSWLGLPVEPRSEPPAEHARPFSCYDERLTYD